MPTRENTAAIIVVFHPGPDVAARIRRLAAIAGRVYIYDNTPNSPTSLALLDQVHDLPVSLHTTRQNAGVAAALNEGVKCATAHAFKWLLTFDQDSDPPSSLLTDLSAALSSTLNNEKIALIGINYQDPAPSSSFTRDTRNVTRDLIPARAVITSGSLLNLSAAADAGPFQNDFFIDEVDHEYALRLRKHGYRVALAPGISMPHALGNMRRVTLLGLTFGVSNHPPSRRYYMARNRVALLKSYLFFDPRFVLSRLALTAWESLVVLLFEPQKGSKLLHTFKGLAHGILGRMGPLKSP